MSLEDFHTKALRLVKEGEYPEGDTQEQDTDRYHNQWFSL